MLTHDANTHSNRGKTMKNSAQIREIQVPVGIEYLSEINEIKNEFGNDLPANAVISKQLTGTGGTTIALTNHVPYVIAVHLIEMIRCKVEQTDRYPNVLGVTGVTTIQEIREYVASGGIKIMVTYDSVPKVQEALGSQCKDFRLLVDEFHKLIAYMGNFKPSVAIKLLSAKSDFKSVSYLTATPTDYRWLPEPMKQLQIINFNWLGKATPDMKHQYVSEGLSDKVLGTILHTLDNTTDEMYIFYNSTVGVSTLLKKLFKCKPTLTLKDINIMFSNTDKNTKYFKKHLGTKFEYGIAPDGVNNKRINVISSMGFEGIDFYPNHITDAKPLTIIVSDPNLKSMRYDIAVDLVQIVGRFRKHKLTNKRVQNSVLYFWNTQKTDYMLNEDEYLAQTIKFRGDDKAILDMSSTNSTAMRAMCRDAEGKDTVHIIYSDDKTPILHPYGIEAQMSAYKTMHVESSILLNVGENGELKDNSSIVNKLLSLDPTLSTYDSPLIKAEYTKLLGRTPSVPKLIIEYENLLEDVYENSRDPELLQLCEHELESFLLENSTFNEWIVSGVTTGQMKSMNMSKPKISERAHKNRCMVLNTDAIKAQLNLVEGVVYTSDELLVKVLEVYKSLGLNADKAKSTDVKQWYTLKQSSKISNGVKVNGYKVLPQNNLSGV